MFTAVKYLYIQKLGARRPDFITVQINVFFPRLWCFFLLHVHVILLYLNYSAHVD